ncbi:MAG: leucine-rich repeat domain-containing protein, partial [Treponema sp.]
MKLNNKKTIYFFSLFLLFYSNLFAEITLKIKDGIVTGYRSTAQEILKLPSNVITIGRQAFEENTQFKELDLSECKSLQLIDYAAFQRCKIEQIKFAQNLKAINAFAFNYCKKLLSLDFSNCENLILIDEYAFNKCENLKILKLPHSLKKIGNRAFYRCNSLKEIDLSHCKNLEYIGEKAF